MKVVSWDGRSINDGVNYTAVLKNARGLPAVSAQWVQRSGRWPLLGGVERPGHKLTLGLVIEGPEVETLRSQLTRWFDPEDETPKALVVEDDDGNNDRYLLAICEAIQATPDGGGLIYVATLALHGDVRWRSASEEQEVWNVTASGQTRVVTNGGQDDAYPRFTIRPTSNKSGSYNYKRFVPWRWRVDAAASKYPLDICNDSFNTAALVTAGKMQSDGDDLRVLVDGVEVDRWLAGMNTSTTKVWVNLDFQPAWEGTLVAAMLAADSVGTLDVNEDISSAPSAGILMIDSEAFTYTAKNNALKRFLGVTRAAKGTTAANHSAGATVWWCQHEIWLLYGNAGAGAPTVNDNYKPAFNLYSSSNTFWDYDDFGENDGLRTAAWVKQALLSTPTFYTAHHGTDANPWQEIGLLVDSLNDVGMWRAHNPCGLVAANFQSGEKYRANAPWRGQIRSSPDGSTWHLEYSIPAPSAAATWESWAQNETLNSGAKYVALYLEYYVSGATCYLEAAGVTLTLDSSCTPTGSIGSELGNYSLACTLSNQTTGQAISLSYTMGLNEELEVDSDARTVVDLEDEASQFQALTLEGGARRDWLPLKPGDNTLRFDDVGTNGVTVTVEWRERYYS